MIYQSFISISMYKYANERILFSTFLQAEHISTQHRKMFLFDQSVMVKTESRARAPESIETHQAKSWCYKKQKLYEMTSQDQLALKYILVEY